MKTVTEKTGLAVLSLLAALVAAGGGCDPTVTIKNPDSLPALKQKQDFAADYTGRESDVEIAGPPRRKVKYDQLDTDVAVGLPIVGGARKNYWAFGFRRIGGADNIVEPDPTNPNDPVRPFHGKPGGAGSSEDWNEIVGGSYHCVPTAAAMVVTYWAKEKGKPNLLAGVPGPQQLIGKLAEGADTNDQNTGKSAGDNHGHFGSWPKDGQEGMQAFAAAAGYRMTATMRAWDLAKYKENIGKDEPVIVFFRNPATKMGHVVAGYGYKGDKILYKDPWTGAAGETDATTVQQATDLAGALARTYGQAPPLPIPPSLAAGRWIDAFELVLQEVSP